jgi:hypothetical protein
VCVCVCVCVWIQYIKRNWKGHISNFVFTIVLIRDFIYGAKQNSNAHFHKRLFFFLFFFYVILKIIRLCQQFAPERGFYMYRASMCYAGSFKILSSDKWSSLGNRVFWIGYCIAWSHTIYSIWRIVVNVPRFFSLQNQRLIKFVASCKLAVL